MFGGCNIGIFYISEIRISSVSYEVAATISLAHRYFWSFSVNPYLRVYKFEFFI